MNIYRKVRAVIRGYLSLGSSLGSLSERLDQVLVNQGRILSTLNALSGKALPDDVEFKIFSQWGEDGLLQHILQLIEVKNKTFIEFGVENFKESNCRFLMEKDSWRGFVVDGDVSAINQVRSSSDYWRYDLTAVCAFITRENINDVLERSLFDYDIGVLSIDIDGNDYHVLNAITKFRPRVLICEFNSTFGPKRKITIPYEANFQRCKKHFSNLYYGASLPALVHCAKKFGYSLVAINRVASNAFFVRGDLLGERLREKSCQELFEYSPVRESRDKYGNLSYLGLEERIAVLRGMPVLNVESGQIEIF